MQCAHSKYLKAVFEELKMGMTHFFEWFSKFKSDVTTSLVSFTNRALHLLTAALYHEL